MLSLLIGKITEDDILVSIDLIYLKHKDAFIQGGILWLRSDTCRILRAKNLNPIRINSFIICSL